MGVALQRRGGTVSVIIFLSDSNLTVIFCLFSILSVTNSYSYVYFMSLSIIFLLYSEGQF